MHLFPSVNFERMLLNKQALFLECSALKMSFADMKTKLIVVYVNFLPHSK